MQQFLDLGKRILLEGDVKFNERTKQGTISKFGEMSRYSFENGFPILTTRPVGIQTSAKEMFWFMRGERNLASLFKQGVHFWEGNGFDMYLRRHSLHDKFEKGTNEWSKERDKYKNNLKNVEGFAEKEGDLGPIYGYQWRHWEKFVQDENGNWVRNEVDQLKRAIDKLKTNPTSRQNIVTAWNAGDIDDMALPPCHTLFQFNVVGDNLDLLMFQRSCDVHLGVPYNITGYSLMLGLIAKEVGLNPRNFVHQYGDTHFYLGFAPRSEFLADSDNLLQFRDGLGHARTSKDYDDLRAWYKSNSPPEAPELVGSDLIPAFLEQLAREPLKRPNLEITSDDSFYDIIQQHPRKVLRLEDYSPHSKLIEPVRMAI